MQVKYTNFRVLVALFTLAVALGGSNVAVASESFDALFASGSPGGNWAQIATMLSDQCQKNIPNFTYTTFPGGGATNPILVARGDANMGMTFLTNLSDIMGGKEQYHEEFPNGATNLRSLTKLGLTSWAYIVITGDIARKYNVSTFKDLIDNKAQMRMNVGQVGQGDEQFSRRLLGYYGLTYEDITSWGGQVTYSPNSDAIDRFVNGAQTNTLLFVERLGLAEVIELFASRECVLVPLDQDALDYLGSTYSYMVGTAPANTFKGQTEEIKMAYLEYCVFTNDTMPEEIAYGITKSILTGKEEFIKTNVAFEAFEPAIAYRDMAAPLHPGAERAFKELGYMK